MERYCTNCNSILNEGARFCAKCGASIPAQSVPPTKLTGTTESIPKPERQTPKTYITFPGQHIDPQYTAQPIGYATEPMEHTANPMQQAAKPMQQAAKPMQQIAQPARKNKNGNILCMVLAIVLVLESVIVALFGWPGFAVGGGFGNTSTFTLGEGQTSVSTKYGAAIDFGTYNDMDGAEVAISELGSETDDIQGGYITSYDFSVEGRKQFDGLVTITLPYDETKTIPGDEENSVLAQYHNPDTGEWELVDYTVNTDSNTVTVYTDHLSKYCTVTVNNPATPYARIAKISNLKHTDTSRAMAILDELQTLGEPGEMAQSLALELLDTFFYYPNLVLGGETSDKIPPAADLAGWLFDAAEPAGPIMEKLGDAATICGIAFSAAQVCYAIHQNESDALIAAEGYKFAYQTSIAYFGTHAMQLSMLGVIAIDYSLNRFLGEANQTYKDDIYTIVKYYNEEEAPRTDKEWYDMVMKLYRRHDNNPEKFNSALKGLMYNFSARFFQLDGTAQYNTAGFAGKKLPYITIDAQNYCIEQYVARLGEQLQPILKDVTRQISYEACKEYRTNLNKLRALLNQDITIDVLEEIPDGEKSVYAKSTVALVRGDNKPNKDWMFMLDDKGYASFGSTVLGYMQAGCPTTLKLWLPGSDPEEDEPDLTQGFVLEDTITSIVLGGGTHKYLLYQDCFESALVSGGMTIEEHYQRHPSMQKERDLEAFKMDCGYVISIQTKNGEAVLMVYEAPESRKESPLYVYGVEGITGVLDKATNTFYASYGNGEEISIDFNTNTAYMDGPYAMRFTDEWLREAHGLQAGIRYGLQPFN